MENLSLLPGSRRDSHALETFHVSDINKGAVVRTVIEENAGPTQTQIFTHGSVDYILSTNQRKNEVALYSSNIE